MVRNPSEGYYINMVYSGLIRNCPITPQAVTIDNAIFGHDIASLKKKTIRKSSEPVVTYYVEIPQRILYLNKEVTLSVDVLFMNGIGFFISTYRRMKFTTPKDLPSCTKGKLGNSLKNVISLYNTSGFKIRTSLMDTNILLNLRFVCAVIRTGLQRRKSVLILFLLVFLI